ncbi:CD1845 family protein [Facklamia sp. P12955]|uniref:CD1845 family protein n=1 Tax=unclassified Facklamia TaxID=2622293 RepID=UPI003D185D94
MKIIRILFRIILLPVQIILTLLELFLTMLLEIGTGVLYLVMLLVLIGTVWAFIQGDTRTGIQGIFLTYLFSPYGLPLIGALVIVPIVLLKEGIKAI